MKPITLLEGIIVAAVLACIGFAASFLLPFAFGWHMAIKTNIALLTLLYLGYLCHRSGIRAGKIVLGVGSAALLAAAVSFIDTRGDIIAFAVVLIALLRALLFAPGIMAGLAHLALCLLGVAFAAYNGGGIGMSAWSFFLVQALWILIPRRSTEQRYPSDNGRNSNRFNQAYATADAAIKLLINGSKQ